MKWRLTPDRFTYAWSEAGLDRIPYPLSVRPTALTDNERATHTPDLAAWHNKIASSDLDVALQLIASSTLRVEVAGDSSSRPVRVLACGVSGVAVVVSQLPGATTDVGGDLTVTLGPVDTLGRRTVSALPAVHAGRSRGCSAPVREVARSSATVVLASPAARSVAGEVRKLLNAPRTGIGHLVVTTDRNERSTPVVLSWIDVVDDGRYLVRTDLDVDVAPATPAEIAAALQHCFDDTTKGAARESAPGLRPHHER